MKQKPNPRRKRNSNKSILRLPRGYRHAIEEFVDWYCPEPRLALIG
jgi:hypothetical protein